MQFLCGITILLSILSSSHPLASLYYCNFDTRIPDECLFDRTAGAPDLIRTTGLLPNEATVQPSSNDIFIRTYAFVKTPSAGAFHHTYSTLVNNGKSSMQCLDFYYFITDASYNAKISILWDDNSVKQPIAEVKASSDSRWQRCQRTYLSPLSSSYYVSFELTRDDGPINFYYALGDINIFDGSCGTADDTILSNDDVRSNVSLTVLTLDNNDIQLIAPDESSTSAQIIIDSNTTLMSIQDSDAPMDSSNTTESIINPDPTTEPIINPDPTTEPIINTDPTTESIINPDPTTESIINPDPTTEPIINPDPTTESIINPDPTTESIINPDPTTEPIINPDPTTEPIINPDPTTEPIINPDPTTESIINPDPTTEPIINPDPTTESIINPDPTTEPILNPDPTTESIINPDPTTDSTTTTESTTRSSTTTMSTMGSSTTAMSTMDSTTTTMSTTGSSTTVTILPPLVSLLQCNFFDLSCISEGAKFVNISDGREFTEAISSDSRDPPRGPVSDATSISKLPGTNETCKVPYKLSELDNTNTAANWEMWFCYKNQCPSASGDVLNCSLDKYALIPFAPGDSSKNITLSVQRTRRFRDGTHEQCLRYYYYITVYDATSNQGQKIQVYIVNDNQTSNSRIIDTVTSMNMTNNGWQHSTVKINASSDSYTLLFRFAVDTFNSTNSVFNRSIYFALDDLELYDNNCSYVEFIKNPAGITGPSPPSDSNLGLALGLSLGLGIPVLLGTIAGSVYYFRKRRRHAYLTSSTDFAVPWAYSDEKYDDTDNQVTMF